MAHRFAEFAIARDIDADFALAADNVVDCLAKRLLKRPLVTRFSSFACTVGGDQLVRAGQAPGVARQDVVGA
jgi:hypothetical protein